MPNCITNIHGPTDRLSKNLDKNTCMIRQLNLYENKTTIKCYCSYFEKYTYIHFLNTLSIR